MSGEEVPVELLLAIDGRSPNGWLRPASVTGVPPEALSTARAVRRAGGPVLTGDPADAAGVSRRRST
jgi:hypothetical protein